ncbi:RsmB/NOP family class I SAM-dependent RNA methyltransferase, partial [Devosia sp.]|uniref:RsmB/NOP family class I SAM-dependent RNA methyltransferase n=1 Tax=Devosia sp. TaxID=1871048 RepID=UPI002EED926D
GAERLADPGHAPGLALRLKSASRLQQVLEGGRFAPLAAADLPDGRDRALANRLVTTALRRHGHLDRALARLLQRGLPAKSGSFEAVLRLSLAQLLFLPELGDHSALFLGVEASKRDPRSRHLSGLMNAVLRRAQAEAAALRALPGEALLPDELARKWRRIYGPEAPARFAEALLAGAALDLTFKDDDPALVAELGGRVVLPGTVRLEARDRPLDQLAGYADGRWWVQDAAAALPARLLDLPAGAGVLDLCAAPGGKTAQLVRAGYAVTALDIDRQRLDRLAQNLDRLRYAATVIAADGTSFRPAVPVDGVLLDAPCSATGTLRRHPEVVWHRSALDIRSRVALQRRFIANAAACLKPGGVLVYCVCSLEPEEGEEQLRWIAGRHPELTPLPVRPEELPGLPAAARSADGSIRTHPGMSIGGGAGEGDDRLDGFFIARFRRR